MSQPPPVGANLVLERFLPYRLSILSQLVSGSIHDQYFEPSGLSIPQWRVMAVLGRFAPLSAREVGERTLLDKVTVSRAVATLLDRHLVARTIDHADRRKSALVLTANGRRLHRHVASLALAYEGRLLEALTQTERRTLDSLLQKLTGHARTLRSAGDPP
jgi:DNA-binding MarR family transcriptional regulator